MTPKSSIKWNAVLSLLVLFFLLSMRLGAEKIPELSLSQIDKIPDMRPEQYFGWLEHSSNDPQTVYRMNFSSLDGHAASIFGKKRNIAWLKLKIINDTNQEDFYISFGNHEYIQVYKCLEDSCRYVSTSGHLARPKDRSISKDESFIKLRIEPSQSLTYLFRIESYRLSENRPIDPKIFGQEKYIRFAHQKQIGLDHIIWMFGFFLGSFVAFMIYPINLFFTTKKSYYLFYVLHILAVIISLTLRTEIDLQFDFFFSYWPRISFGLYHVCALFSIPFYILFINNILELKKERLAIYKLVRVIFWLCIGVIVIASILSIFRGKYYLSHDIVFVGKILAMTAGIVFFIALVWSGKLASYIAYGTLFLVLGALITNVLRIYHISSLEMVEAPILKWNLFYVHAGIFMEFIFFSLALSYKYRQISIEKETALKNWIDQLEKTKQIQENYKTELEKEVKTQTEKIINYRKRIEHQEQIRVREEFNKKIVDLELKVLRSQMNPHFMFNSLNSIKLLMQNKEEEKAIHYLNKFSKLLRSILNVSNKSLHSLEDEIEICTLYLDIESIRFSDKFEYYFDMDPSIDSSFVQIPSLLLQPYLENAIWHGLLHKEGHRHLIITIRNRRKYVEVSIRDNGIGRKKALEIKAKRKQNHKSIGMQIGQDRVELYNSRNEQKLSIVIKDHYTPSGDSLGTELILKLPYDQD